METFAELLRRTQQKLNTLIAQMVEQISRPVDFGIDLNTGMVLREIRQKRWQDHPRRQRAHAEGHTPPSVPLNEPQIALQTARR
ncbi:hypothetical protein D3C80_1871040 [compost metagenome]